MVEVSLRGAWLEKIVEVGWVRAPALRRRRVRMVVVVVVGGCILIVRFDFALWD